MYTLSVCKIFGPKIRSCKFFDKSQVSWRLVLFFLGHNLLYFGLRKDILWRLTRSAKERWGRVQNFDFNTFLERWESLVQKRGIRVSAKLTILFDFNPISWRQAAHFLFFFVCVYTLPASYSLCLAHTFFPLFLFRVIPLFLFPFRIFCFLCFFTPFLRSFLIFLHICLISLKDFEMSLKNHLIISLFVF